MALNIYKVKHKTTGWSLSKKYFDVFGLFSKLRACNVSEVARGVFVDVGNSTLLAQELSGEPITYVFLETNG